SPSSALALAALLQALAGQTPATGTAADSLVALREHLARDSSDGHAWLLLGRLYLQRVADAHEPPHRALQDSALVRSLLDSADDALGRAGQLLAPSGATPDGDSARVLRATGRGAGAGGRPPPARRGAPGGGGGRGGAGGGGGGGARRGGGGGGERRRAAGGGPRPAGPEGAGGARSGGEHVGTPALF